MRGLVPGIHAFQAHQVWGGQRRALRAVPTLLEMVGTLRFAHPTHSRFAFNTKRPAARGARAFARNELDRRSVLDHPIKSCDDVRAGDDVWGWSGLSPQAAADAAG